MNLQKKIFNDRKLATIGIYDSYKQNLHNYPQKQTAGWSEKSLLNAVYEPTRKFLITEN